MVFSIFVLMMFAVCNQNNKQPKDSGHVTALSPPCWLLTLTVYYTTVAGKYVSLKWQLYSSTDSKLFSGSLYTPVLKHFHAFNPTKYLGPDLVTTYTTSQWQGLVALFEERSLPAKVLQLTTFLSKSEQLNKGYTFGERSQTDSDCREVIK